MVELDREMSNSQFHLPLSKSPACKHFSKMYNDTSLKRPQTVRTESEIEIPTAQAFATGHRGVIHCQNGRSQEYDMVCCMASEEAKV